MTDPIGTDYPVPFTADEFGVIRDADGDTVGKLLAPVAAHVVGLINKSVEPTTVKNDSPIRRQVVLEHEDGSKLAGIETYFPLSFESSIEVPSIGRADPRLLWQDSGWRVVDERPKVLTVAEGVVEAAAAAWYEHDHRVVEDFTFARAAFETRAAYIQRVKPALAAALRSLAADQENVEVGVEGEDFIGYTADALKDLANDIEEVDRA